MVAKAPLSLRAYGALTHAVPLFAKWHLRRRIETGKEDRTRWVERLGQASIDRPEGTLIWLHAVGLGEVLSLRGLVHAMASHSDAHFLITTGTSAAAKVLDKNAPPRTFHQFLPLDTQRYRDAFLDHWQPDLCVWAEQELWPGFVQEVAKRDIPQAYVVARMSADSARRKARFSAAFRHLYAQMALVTAYDADTQGRLKTFGIQDAPLTGSIKPTAPPLRCDEAELAVFQRAVAGRFVWIVAPSHPADEALALSTHRALLRQKPDALLIIVPRDPKRLIDCPIPHAIRSRGEIPDTPHQVYLADTFGDLGLLYRISDAALIGGTFDQTEGHSPWEAANLKAAVFHGPRTTNFSDDYTTLDAAGAAVQVTQPDALAAGLCQDLAAQVARADDVIDGYQAATDTLARSLLKLL